MIVDVSGEEANKEWSFEDPENYITIYNQGKVSEEAQKPQQEHVNAQQRKTRAKKETKEVFMDSRESRRFLSVLWASELSDHSFNNLFTLDPIGEGASTLQKLFHLECRYR